MKAATRDTHAIISVVLLKLTNNGEEPLFAGLKEDGMRVSSTIAGPKALVTKSLIDHVLESHGRHRGVYSRASFISLSASDRVAFT